MALNNFIPEVWSARILLNLHNNLVYGQPGVINRDYEGDIQQAGDTVRINSVGPVTIGDYTKNVDIAAPDTLTDAQTLLVINNAKFYNFAVDDVDRVQQSPKVMDAAMAEAAYALANTIDAFIAGLYTDASAANLIGTTAAPKTDLASASVPYNYLVDLGVLLDNANVPSAGRWVIVPPWFHGYLLKDSRFISAGTPATDAVIRTGVIGEAAGFRILKSNNVPQAAAIKYRIIAGHAMAWSFASQLQKTEAYRPEKRFADAMKGLALYGAKVVKPAALAVLTANPT